MENENKDYERLKKQEKLQKSTAKFWGIIIAAVLVIAAVWAIVSHLL